MWPVETWPGTNGPSSLTRNHSPNSRWSVSARQTRETGAFSSIRFSMRSLMRNLLVADTYGAIERNAQLICCINAARPPFRRIAFAADRRDPASRSGADVQRHRGPTTLGTEVALSDRRESRGLDPAEFAGAAPPNLPANEELIARLAGEWRTVDLDRGQVLFTEGDRPDFL